MRTSLLLCILLHAAAATAGEVLVEEPLVKVVATRADLRAFCRVDGHYDACTVFIGFRLEATCGVDGGSWTMSASGRYRPWIFLDNMTRLSHEHEHIEDVRTSLNLHLRALEALHFESESDCRATVMAESARFGSSMRNWAVQSNLAHHPRLASGTR